MSKVKVKPDKIRLETSSICQLRCPSCPNTSKAIVPVIGNGFLKLVDFRNLLDRNPWIKEIELSSYGEIFMNPDLLDIIKFAHEKKVVLHADGGVNLNTVKEKVLEGLVRYSFKSMKCSIDGASNETYTQYRVNGNFESVLENIRKINIFKKQYRTKYPLLTWQFIVFGFNEHEIPKAKQLANELGMKFQIKLSWDPNFSPVKDKDYIRQKIGGASRDEFEQKHGVDYKRKICHELWDQPQINWDGKILGCCRNFWGDFSGNAFKDGVLDCLNNEEITYARGMLIGKNEPKDSIPCTRCSIYLSMRARGKYLNRTRPYFLLRHIYRTIKLRYYP